MITFTITGTVKVAETGVGLPGLFVKAYDKDILFDDLLGSAITGEGGRFDIVSEMKDFRDFFDVKPDIYLKVYTGDRAKELHAAERGIRWNAGKVEDFEVRIPLKELGKSAPPRKVMLLDEKGEARTSYDPGESLIVHISGLEADTVHELTVSDDGGVPLFTSTLLSNVDGEIEPTVLWPQFGLFDPRTEERFTVAQAQERWGGRAVALQVRTRGRMVMEQSVKITATFRRPLVLNTDPEGYVLNSFEVGRHGVIVSAYNLPSSGAVRVYRVYMVPRQHNWFAGNSFTPVELASGRTAFAEVEVGARQSSVSARLARAKELRPGAYDFIIRELRYGYEDDEDMIVRDSDLVTRMVTGLVIRWEFMAWKAVLGGCTNTQPISGRSVSGAPYFQYADTFQPGEKVYGALDPAALSPDQKGKMVALYVVKRPVADYAALTHLPQLGGNAGVQKIFTQTGCINQNKILLWNSAEVGEYDIVADFGNNMADPSSFLPDAAFNQPLDMVDGKLVAGFRVVTDPGLATTPGIPHSGTFSYTEAQQGTLLVNDPHSGTTTVNLVAEVRFPAALSGITDPAQISPFAPSYPLIVCVHGNGHNFSNYTYLLDHWAKNGFIAASIHLNGGMAKEGRARVMLKHIDILKATFGAHLQNNIGIMGHSRGGEGVVAAARINHAEALGHNINAIISLGPTDQYFPREILAAPYATPYLVMHGAMDGDVANPGFMGFSLYDRASGEPQSMAWLYGANHNRFNEVNPDGDLNTGKMDPADHPKILTAASHRVLALAYMTGFFRWHLSGANEYQGMFRGEWTPASVAQTEPAINKIYFQYRDPATNVVDDFEQAPHNWQTGTNVAVDDANTLPVDPQEAALATLDGQSPHDTAGLLLRWDTNTDKLVFTPNAVMNVSNFQAISFRAGQKVDSAHNPANQPQDLYLTLTDAANKSRSIRVDAFGDVPPQQKRTVNQFTVSALTTIRIPLHVFQTEVINAQKVDLTQIQTVTFDFKANGSGEIEIDSVEFTT